MRYFMWTTLHLDMYQIVPNPVVRLQFLLKSHGMRHCLVSERCMELRFL